jgi:hypothetical protein
VIATRRGHVTGLPHRVQHVEGQHATPSPAAQQVDAQVRGDPVQPGPHRPVGPFAGAPRAGQGLLDDVLRLRERPHQAVAVDLQLAPVAFRCRGEGVARIRRRYGHRRTLRRAPPPTHAVAVIGSPPGDLGQAQPDHAFDDRLGHRGVGREPDGALRQGKPARPSATAATTAGLNGCSDTCCLVTLNPSSGLPATRSAGMP